MPQKLKPHHVAWLESHPHRTEEWMRERFKDGFDIHHIDEDKENNDPENLVMIEHTDHMMLHGGRTIGRISQAPRKGNKGMKYKPRRLTFTKHRTLTIGRTAYIIRVIEMRAWPDLGSDFGISKSAILARAKTYAKVHDLPWPPPSVGAFSPDYQSFLHREYLCMKEAVQEDEEWQRKRAIAAGL